MTKVSQTLQQRGGSVFVDAMIEAMLRDQIERVWGAGETARVDELYAVDVVDRMPVPGQPGGRGGLKQVVHEFRGALPDLSMTLHGTIVAGDIGVDWWTLTGTHRGELYGVAPTGARVSFGGIDMVRVAEGRIAELWHVEEMLQFGAQIGLPALPFGAPLDAAAVPPPTLDYEPGANAVIPGAAALIEREARNLALGRRHIEEMWARGRVELAHEIYAPEVVDLNPAPGQRPGIEGLIDVVGWLREAVPDLRMSIACYVAGGDHVADRWTMRGHHTGADLLGVPARGRAFQIAGMDIAHFRDDGLIDSVFHVEELAQLRRQIG